MENYSSGLKSFCTSCKEKISGPSVDCDGHKFHLQCFVCEDCKAPAVQIIEEKTYCANCHPDKHICNNCGKLLRGSGLVAGGKFYHEECFVCERCENVLVEGRYNEIDGFILCSPCLSAISIASRSYHQ